MGKIRKNTWQKKNNRRRGSVLLIVVAIVAVCVAAVFLIDRFSGTSVQNVNSSGQQRVTEQHPMPPRTPVSQMAVEPHQTVVHEDENNGAAHQPERHRGTRVSGSGSLGIIVDDMGKTIREARSLLDIDAAITRQGVHREWLVRNL